LLARDRLDGERGTRTSPTNVCSCPTGFGSGIGTSEKGWKQRGEGPSMAIEQWLTDVEIGS
jgi:hypothetical protein